MNLNKLFKRITIVAVSVLGLSVFSPIFAQAETTNETAQKLVNSLKALEVDQVEYLYTYMQSVKLTDTEYNKIVANADKVASLLQGVNDPTKLTDGNKAEILNIFLESSQLAHVKINFVDKTGKSIDLTKYNFSDGLKLQINDLNGKLLATIDPSKDDLSATVLASKVEALKTAVDAKVILEKTGKFVPMPGAKLPETSSDLPLNIAIGGILVVLGALAIKPAINMARKIEHSPEV
jgi:hypothetical protein